MPNPALPDAACQDEVDGVLDKCMLRDPVGIRALLLQLIDRRCTLAATDEGGSTSLVTAPLAIDAGVLWIDVPRDPDVLQRLLRGQRLSFQGVLDKVTVRFVCGPAALGVHGGLPALALPLPTRLLHLQRREIMRREPPAESLHCLVSPADADESTPPVAATIRDIGGGGLALLTPEKELALGPGDLLPRCTIELPGLGAMAVSLRVRHVRHSRQRGHDVRQAGCEFVGLSQADQAKLFRYLMQLDREQLSRRAALKAMEDADRDPRDSPPISA